jgi:hypothetical protein
MHLLRLRCLAVHPLAPTSTRGSTRCLSSTSYRRPRRLQSRCLSRESSKVFLATVYGIRSIPRFFAPVETATLHSGDSHYRRAWR